MAVVRNVAGFSWVTMHGIYDDQMNIHKHVGHNEPMFPCVMISYKVRCNYVIIRVESSVLDC